MKGEREERLFDMSSRRGAVDEKDNCSAAVLVMFDVVVVIIILIVIVVLDGDNDVSEANQIQAKPSQAKASEV